MEFKVIKGLVGKYLDNEILVDSEKSDPKAVDAMMTYLTAEDKALEELSTASRASIPYQQIATIGAAAAVGTTFQIIGAL